MKKTVKILIVAFSFLLLYPVYASSSSLLILTEKNFQQTIMGERPVLVKFWAAWCEPCRRMAPKFRKVSKSYVGQILFAELNVDKAKEIANRYQVNTIPTTILFIKGKEMDRFTGGLNVNQIDYWASEILRGRYE